MKYFAIILLSFALVSPALAARTVNGTVPQVKPLQPAPVGISPGYNKNVQSQGPAIENGAWGGGSSATVAAHTAPEFLPVIAAAPNRLVVWIALLLAAVIFVWVFFNKRKKQ